MRMRPQESHRVNPQIQKVDQGSNPNSPANCSGTPSMERPKLTAKWTKVDNRMECHWTVR